MDIKKIIEKLNGINVKDLKNIDISQVKSVLLGKPHMIVNVVLIVLTFIFCVHSFGKNKLYARSLKIEIPKLENTLKAVDENKKTTEEYNNFIENFPEVVSNDEFINKLSNIAVNNNVQIISFSPTEENENDFMNLITVEMDISADTYANLLRFVKDIEDSPYTIRISQWQAALVNTQRGRRRAGQIQQEEATPIQAHLEIGSVAIKK